MPGFKPRSIERISDAVRYVERRLRNERHRRGRWQGHDWRPIRRFEMTDALALPQSGAGHAGVYTLAWDPDESNWAGQDDRQFRVVDAMRAHSKMATASDELGGDVGAYGIAWLPDDPPRRGDEILHGAYVPVPSSQGYDTPWEILWMQTPGDFLGQIGPYDALDSVSGDSAEVTAFDVEGSGHRTFGGYDPFGDAWVRAHGGAVITVYNLPRYNVEGVGSSKYWFNAGPGDIVYCQWHMREAKYYVTGVASSLRVEGDDASHNSVNTPGVLHLFFDTDDFSLTVDSDAKKVTIALR